MLFSRFWSADGGTFFCFLKKTAFPARWGAVFGVFFVLCFFIGFSMFFGVLYRDMGVLYRDI